MRKVLITGCAGFIGSHLTDLFLKKGFKVIGIDNYISGSPENILDHKYHPNFKFIEEDIINLNDWQEEVDLVLNFACPASPVAYMNNPLETMKTGSIGTLNTLEIALKNDARYIFASTSEVYGDPLIHPQKENYYGNVNPNGPRSVYDESKRFSESLIMAYHNKFDLDTRIIRIFNTYGPRMQINDGRVVPNFIYQALRGKDLTVYGDGSQTRSFCYIDDLIQGIFKISQKEKIKEQVMNLGNPEEYQIIDFARIIIKKTVSNSKIVFEDLPQDDPKRRCPDISKVKKIIDWKPKVSLDKGIQQTIEYFKKK